MRLVEKAIYRGPHYFSALPMVRLKVDLGPLDAGPSSAIDGFNDRLLTCLPGLANHGCSYGEPGGFIRRLDEGTWLGHVAEHVALELQTLSGQPVSRGKTRSVRGQPGVYNILFAYQDEAVGLQAGYEALRLVDSLLPPELAGLDGVPGVEGGFDLGSALRTLAELVRKSALGPTTAALVHEARRRGIPVTRLNENSLIRLGWGARQRILRASVTERTGLIAAEVASDKGLAKSLMLAAGIPAPKGEVVRTKAEALKAAGRLKGPLVVKPLDANHGRGVTLGLRAEADIGQAFDTAAAHGRRVIVEQQLVGRDYRVLVVAGQVAAVAERVPAQVTGDGTRSIRQLIEEVNADPRRGAGHEAVLTRIQVDAALARVLSQAGLDLSSVPAAGQVVQLRDTANLSSGGVAIDRTGEIHPDNAAIARRAAGVVGLDVAGIDLVAPDIARSVHETGGGIVEVNAAPGLRMHLAPSEGRPRDVARPIIDSLFPRRQTGRIPLAAITGTNGKSTTVRMVAHILARQGLNVGYATTSGVVIGRERVTKADASGPKSARMVLADLTVEVAVLETARGGILREGLGFDRADVGCCLNVTEDHLGLKGIATVEDLAAVKSVVTESVRRKGLSVLNADDPLTLRMARHARGRLAWFSLRGGLDASPALQKHIALGGLAAVVEPEAGGEALVVYDRGARIPLLSVRDMPIALGGAVRFNLANGLAAALVAHGLNVPWAAIADGLGSFTPSFEDNPGRMNVHDAHGFRTILDYAHNPAGLTALGDVVRALADQHRRIIGCVSIPGDRRDEDIRQMGRLAADLFDDVVFRERPDGRGRAMGEVLRLMKDGALEAGMPAEHVRCIADEAAAMTACLDLAREGDLVILLPTNVEGMWRLIQDYRPWRPAAAAMQQEARAHG